MDYTTFGSYNIGSAIRYVAKQNRGDFDKKQGLGLIAKIAILPLLISTPELMSKINLALGWA